MARGHLVLEHAIDAITVGHQYRRDLGDLNELVESIRRLGLLHPVAVTSTYVLISGNRRLAALRKLGHTSVAIWVVPDVSDKLTTVLAIQNENTLQKALTPIEQAELYAELKALYTEDAVRRVAETRFGSPSRRQHLIALQTSQDGGADSAPPPHDAGLASLGRSNKARTQAARAVTGRDSRSMLEQVVQLQMIAADDSEDPLVRQAAAEALFELNQDGKVDGRYLRVKLAQHKAALSRLADDPNTTDTVRIAASTELAALAQETHPKTAVKAAALAVGRVAEIQKTERARTAPIGWSDTDPFLRQKHEVRKLVDLLRREHGWWNRFDPAVIAEHASDKQWDLINTAAAGANAFVTTALTARKPELA
ncbi:ParB N-terminal domain-containing protein [Rathayibacter soli]|uniref:ParB N-terminal domain-containing protein n=1 Tax=Rathayibacter soli TaxID=3144168 RepID=UPI0027E4B0C1|nr:ParB N-terminal domain-containing protein [Glaciibacter superstes]